MSKNLEPGQFQLADLVMGYSTLYSVESLDIGNYDVNVQDSQAPDANEITFGQDTLKPASMQLTINFRKNKQLANVSALLKNPKTLNFDDDPTLADLQRVWRGSGTFDQWMATEPLYFCGSDGITRQFFGRPGKFGYKLHRIVDSQYYICTAEYRRLDTFAHSETEWFRTFVPNTPQTLTLLRGNAQSWVRFLISGPVIHPVINFGDKQIELDTSKLPGGTIAADQIVEISGYPWERRAILQTTGSSTAITVAPYIISDDPYLAHLSLPNNTPTEISWTGTALTGASSMSVLWHDAYQVLD